MLGRRSPSSDGGGSENDRCRHRAGGRPMKPFTYERASSITDSAKASAEPGTKLLAGGTNLLDLMKLQIEAPVRVIDINRLPLKAIEDTADGGLRLGALATNTQVAADPRVRSRYPVLTRAILAGA